jgi:hypothetical protein
MPVVNPKIKGVVGSGDTNEMSYVDMHDLHPVNVSAAVLDGAMSGAATGASITALPIGLATLLFGIDPKGIRVEGDEWKGDGKSGGFRPKALLIGGAIIACTALIMGAVRAFTAGKQAQTHNAWSAKVLDHMQQREATEAAKLTLPAATYAEQAQADKLAAAAEPAQRG